jgi:fido (protein-threonine AMPylation protein)
MPGPGWSDDDPADAQRIVASIGLAVQDARMLAAQRKVPTAADLRQWHETIYAGCTVPSQAYVGNFRGDRNHPDLVDYEVQIGADMPDGFAECVGVWAANVASEVDGFFQRLRRALHVLDTVVSASARPTDVDVLHEVVALVAVVHGEWVRIHPFANGNGRTARLLVAHLALRYGLPVFVTRKPRPHDIAYARASKASMGRPPDFVSDHSEATAVFAHLLSLKLLGD